MQLLSGESAAPSIPVGPEERAWPAGLLADGRIGAIGRSDFAAGLRSGDRAPAVRASSPGRMQQQQQQQAATGSRQDA